MARKKKSNEAYVYWFYNKYNFKTYIGYKVAYSGSYKDNFLKEYNSSSEDEEFLRALENEELVGEVIAVFTGGTYKEVGKRANKYEQALIKLFWNTFGKENSYNKRIDSGEWNTIGKSLPHSQEVIDKYYKGKNNGNYKDICPAVLQILRLELNYGEKKIADLYNVDPHTIGRKLRELKIDTSKRGKNTFKKRQYSKDFGKSVSKGLKLAYQNGLKPANRVEIDYEILFDLYVNKKLCMQKIADELNTTLHVVHNRLIEYNIPRRRRSHIAANKNRICLTDGKHRKYFYKGEETEFLNENPNWDYAKKSC